MKRLLVLITLFIVSSSHSQELQSIHENELEHYNSLGNASAGYYEAIPTTKSVSIEKSGCNLNKIVYGWHPYWSGSAFNNYQWDLLTHFSFFSYEVNSADGQAISTHGWSTSTAVDAALSNGVKVTLCVTLFSGHSTFFGSPASQQTLITNLINLVQSRGAHGVNIDFEGLPSSQATNFANFMVNLSNQMHTAIPGSEVSTVLYAVDWNNVFDIAAMEPEVDHYIIMGYDYYYSGSSTAGPTDPLYQFGTTYNYTISRSISYYLNDGVPADKLVLGLPYYGWDFPTSGTTIPSGTTGSGSSRTYTTVRTDASSYFSDPNHSWVNDAVSDAYIYNNGVDRQCFISMDSAFNKRLDHVLKTGIAGIGMWALGYDDGYQERWNSIRDYLTDCYSDPCSGSIHDFGGPEKSYYNYEDYTWTIQPAEAVTIDVNFTEFNIENNWDYLYVYDGPNSSSPQITGSPFTGTSGPGSFSTTGNAITFRFTSDVSTVGPGFYATYSCNSVPPPVAGFNVSSSTTICLGDSVLLQSTSSDADENLWSTTEGTISDPNASQTYLIPSSSGIYDVTLNVTNSQGSDAITQSLNVIIENPSVADATVNNSNLTLPDAFAFFSNNSMNADSYWWDFGDGSYSTDSNPWHEYSASGIYIVQLVAFNDICGNDTTVLTITVGEAYLDENDLSGINVYPNPATNEINIHVRESMTGIIRLEDINGKMLEEIEINESNILPVSTISSGIYIVRISTNKGVYTHKVIITH